MIGMTTKKQTRPAKAQKSRKSSDRCAAIPFANKDGHVMRLSGSMTIRELLKMGVVEIHLAKPGTPLREGEWRDASPEAFKTP